MQTKWEQFCLRLAGSYFNIWFVFYASLPNQIKLLLFNFFFFDQFHLIKSIFEIQKKSTNITEFILSIYEKWNTRLIHFYLCWKQVLLKQEKEFQSNYADPAPKKSNQMLNGIIQICAKKSANKLSFLFQYSLVRWRRSSS